MAEKMNYHSNGLLKGQHCIVTGGASGIGKAIVKDFLQEGARVSFFDINKEAVDKLQVECRHSLLRGFEVDITKKEELKRIFKKYDFEDISVLVNNAGGGKNFSFENPDEKVWDEVFNLNFDGARYVTELVIPKMLKRARGSIVFITSVHTSQAFSQESAYDSSKHALVGMMRVIALDYGGRGIRCNAIAPGSIYPTGITNQMSEKEVCGLAKKVPLQRLGKPEEIAKVATFIASDQASYINGAEIRVDGGLSIKNSLLF